MDIGYKIKEERIRKGISKQKVAEAAGLSIRTIYNIESDKHSPTLKNIEKIARALEINPAILFL